jgi:hypothetical protein
MSTQISGVNDAGTMTGTWQAENLAQFGFIWQPDGQVISFSAFNLDTSANAINDAGTVVGATCSCGPGPFQFQGYVRSPDGTFTQLDDPSGSGSQTVPTGINDSGVVAGYYADASSGATLGFIDRRGKFTTLWFPGSTFTVATAINNWGTIVGLYGDALGLSHGFRYRLGKFTEIDAPNAGTNPAGSCLYDPEDDQEGTIPQGISAGGAIVGDVCNDVGAPNSLYGWRLGLGQFSALNDPNAGPQGTLLGGISENGRMVAGAYFDPGGVEHGLVATLWP